MSPSNEPTPPVPVPPDLPDLAARTAERAARLRAPFEDRHAALLREIDVALAPVLADEDVDRRAYAEHERAAAVDVIGQHKELLAELTPIVAARMTKVYALTTIRRAVEIGDDRYLVARVKGIVGALAEIDPLP